MHKHHLLLHNFLFVNRNLIWKTSRVVLSTSPDEDKERVHIKNNNIRRWDDLVGHLLCHSLW